MATLKRFYVYWSSTLSGAKDVYEKAMKALGLMAGGLAIFGFTRDFSPIVNALSIATAAAVVLRAIFWLPFKRHEAQENRHLQEIQELRNSFTSAQKNEDFAQRALEFHNEAIKQNKKKVLAEFLIKLESRIHEVEASQPNIYVAMCGATDKKSKALVDDIGQYIRDNLGVADAALFLSTTNISWTPNPFFHPPRTLFVMHRRSNIPGGGCEDDDWQTTKDALRHWAEQLKEIIRKQV